MGLLSMVGKIYVGILEDRVRRMTEGLMMTKGVSDQGESV